MSRRGPGFALVLLALSGCGGGPSSPSPVALDSDFELRAGESVAVAEAGLTVRFVAVADDSRCPANAQCVWAGDAIVRLRVHPERGAEQPVDLHTSLEPNEAAFGGYLIRLRLLAPLPRAGQPVAPRDYVATLRVVRAA